MKEAKQRRPRFDRQPKWVGVDLGREDGSVVALIQDVVEGRRKVSVIPLMPAATYPDFERDRWTFCIPMDECMASSMARWEYIRKHGFVLLTLETVQALATLLAGRRVMDAGAGTGYLSFCLQELGVDITPVDDASGGYGFTQEWLPITKQDVVTLLPGEFDTVLLSWPNYDTDYGFRVLQAMAPGQMLIYQGEGPGGCTGDDQFHAELESGRWTALARETWRLNRHHRVFWGIHDGWRVYRKAE